MFDSHLPGPLYAAKPYLIFGLAGFALLLNNPMGYLAATILTAVGIFIIKMRRG